LKGVSPGKTPRCPPVKRHHRHSLTSVALYSGPTLRHAIFIFIGYTENSLEYSAVNTLYINNYAATNKTCSGKKTPTVTRAGIWALTLRQWCKWRHSKSRQLTVNKPATDSGVDLKV
jgi:hypothetical protein